MRTIATILALLTLILSCLPCADVRSMPYQEQMENLIPIQHEQRHTDHQEDGCSPFCHCMCCAGFSILHYTVTVPAPPVISHAPEYAVYLTTPVMEIAFPVWQPPQLS